MHERIQARYELVLDIPEDKFLPERPVGVVAPVLPVI
jgi:hypothetical protein